MQELSLRKAIVTVTGVTLGYVWSGTSSFFVLRNQISGNRCLDSPDLGLSNGPSLSPNGPLQTREEGDDGSLASD